MLVLLLGLPATQTVNAAGPGADELPYAESIDKHFHPKGKPPSEHTLAIIRKACETMPFSDRRDFEIEELDVDGVRMIFQNTPGTEAPSEMNTYLPDKKALWMAENVSGTIHNIYTLRGAPVRDALAWSKYIARALNLYGKEAEVMFAAHHWPRWGNDRIQEVLRGQRDAYAHLNNQVLYYVNQGVTINQIHNVYRVPPSLEDEWFARGYHGSPQHNSRGVVNRYIGYWDANPKTLIPLSPEDSAPLYVEMMGSESIMRRGQELYDEGKYFYAQEIVDKLVWAQPDNQEAKDLLADIFEQIGYQQENPDLTITIDRSDLSNMMMGQKSFAASIEDGTAQVEGNVDILAQLAATLVTFEIGFEILPGTAGPAGKVDLNPYEVPIDSSLIRGE